MPCWREVVNRLDSCKYYILSAVVYGVRNSSGYYHCIRRLSWSSEKKGNPPCNSEDNLHAGLLIIESHVQGLLRESRTKGSSGVRPIILWAGLMGCEDMKVKDCTVSGLDSTWRGRQAWRPKMPSYVTDSM